MSDPEYLSAGESGDDMELGRAAEQETWLKERIGRFIVRPDTPVIPAGKYPPEGEFGGLYMLFDKDGGLNYVGKSVGVGYRSIQHLWAMRRGKRLPFVEYAAIEVPWEYIDHLEVAHIHALEPPENAMLPRVSWNFHSEAVKLIQDIWGPKK